jgi:hypothetical protein
MRLKIIFLCVVGYAIAKHGLKYKGLVLIESKDVIGESRFVNLTIGGQVQFRKFLKSVLFGCSNAKRGSGSLTCPIKAILNPFTYACCNDVLEPTRLTINSVNIGLHEMRKLFQFLNTRVDDSFTLTEDIQSEDEMLLVANVYKNFPATAVNTYNEEEYQLLKDIIVSYPTLCLLENTSNNMNAQCPRIYTRGAYTLCCDFDDTLMSVKIDGYVTLYRGDVILLRNAMLGVRSD